MTTLAAMRATEAATGTDPAATGADFALLPEATAPHGPGAARQVAQRLADAGHHSHLHAHGEDVCLTGQCPAALLTPGQVLL